MEYNCTVMKIFVYCLRLNNVYGKIVAERGKIMFLLFVALVFAVIGIVFTDKVYYYGLKQFRKYDMENSCLTFDSIDDLISKIKMFPDVDIISIDKDSNTVTIRLKRNKYCIVVENNIAYVEYNNPYSIKFSRIGRIIRTLKVNKAVKKAVLINKLLDKVADNYTSNDQKSYKKCLNSSRWMTISVIMMIVCLVLGCFSMLGNLEQDAIDNVKSTHYNERITYDQIIDRYLINAEWEAFNSDRDMVVVEVNGMSVENEMICIQFSGEAGLGFNGVDHQEFELHYFAVDGESIDPNAAMEYILDYLK